MAQLVIFPDPESYEQGKKLFLMLGVFLKTLDPPTFCRPPAAPAVLVSCTVETASREISAHAIPVSGVLPHVSFAREVPEAGPPDPRILQILGDLRIAEVRRSVSDPAKLRAEIVSEKSLEPLIPIMARIIRGGTYRPGSPILAFEEDHRLMVILPHQIVMSRVDDLLDIWVMARCMMELVVSAWKHRAILKPDPKPRQGIGATEIYRRLPATDCGRCGCAGCMEFAVRVLVHGAVIEECMPLLESDMLQKRNSLQWLLGIIGQTDFAETDGAS